MSKEKESSRGNGAKGRRKRAIRPTTDQGPNFESRSFAAAANEMVAPCIAFCMFSQQRCPPLGVWLTARNVPGNGWSHVRRTHAPGIWWRDHNMEQVCGGHKRRKDRQPNKCDENGSPSEISLSFTTGGVDGGCLSQGRRGVP